MHTVLLLLVLTSFVLAYEWHSVVLGPGTAQITALHWSSNPPGNNRSTLATVESTNSTRLQV